MHIAFLTSEYPHPQITHAGGIGTSIKNLVTALVQKGIAVSVVVYGQKESVVLEEDGVRIHLIKHQKYAFLGWYWHRKYIQNYLNALVTKEKIDLIEAPDWTGITAFMNLKAPLIIRFHGSDTYFCHLEKRKQKIKNYWFEKLAAQKAKAYIAPTDFAGNLSRKLLGIPISKWVKTIHYGLNLAHFKNDQPEVFQKGLLLYIGTIIRKKGVFELPAILEKVTAQYPEVQLVLIGADASDIQTGTFSTWELISQKMKNKNLKNVTYLGKIPYQEVQDYIKKAHVCVFPSFAETLGMVTIESMALQKPVVNTNIGWAQELMEDGKSGFLVHPQNHEVYAGRITTLLKNESTALKMGVESKKYIEQHFDIQKIVEQNIAFYQSISTKN